MNAFVLLETTIQLTVEEEWSGYLERVKSSAKFRDLLNEEAEEEGRVMIPRFHWMNDGAIYPKWRK